MQLVTLCDGGSTVVDLNRGISGCLYSGRTEPVLIANFNLSPSMLANNTGHTKELSTSMQAL